MLTRWNPFTELISMRDAINRLFDDGFLRPSMLFGTVTGMGAFPCDVYETGDQIVVRAAIPGVDPNQIDLTVNQGVLTIKGSRSLYAGEQQPYTWHVRGLGEGTFQFSISLPTAVNADAAYADYEAGILTVTLPKAETAKAKRITITGARQSEALPAGAP